MFEQTVVVADGRRLSIAKFFVWGPSIPFKPSRTLFNHFSSSPKIAPMVLGENQRPSKATMPPRDSSAMLGASGIGPEGLIALALFVLMGADLAETGALALKVLPIEVFDVAIFSQFPLVFGSLGKIQQKQKSQNLSKPA